MRTPEQIGADYEQAKAGLENAWRRIETQAEWERATRTSKSVSKALDVLIPPQLPWDARLFPAPELMHELSHAVGFGHRLPRDGEVMWP